MSNVACAISACDLVHKYDDYVALDGLSLSVAAGEIFALLGPNGSGKTTFFRLVSTLLPIQSGTISIYGADVAQQTSAVRHLIGVVFQSNSIDGKLTVRENLHCQGMLYGLSRTERNKRIARTAEELGVTDRLDWRVDKLSGGLARRVDIAKSLLHAPRLLLLDEPSTGLDPAARIDLWHALESLRSNANVTVVLTTHLLEEAEKCDRIGILHRGKPAAQGRPHELRERLGHRILTIETDLLEEVRSWLEANDLTVKVQDQQLRASGPNITDLIAPLTSTFGDAVRSLSVAQPSLEDVFIAETGHRFWDATTEDGQSRADGSNKTKKGRRR
ncbi:MAG: ABC transporter ATP-binding protein [Pirellulales bacterium]